MRCLHPVLGSLVLLVVAAAPLHADVLVVDPNGGGDYLDPFTAVAAAADGDTLLLRPYTLCPGCEFDGFWVDGKSLTIVFDSPLGSAGAYPIPGIGVRNLRAGQTVVLRGLKSESKFFPVNALHLMDNEGAVWVEDCLLIGSRGGFLAGPGGCLSPNEVPGQAGLHAENSADVTVVDCVLAGGDGANAFFNEANPLSSVLASDGGPALEAIASRIAVHGSTLTAGDGGNGQLCFEIGDGGPGVTAKTSAQVLLSGCVVTGGVQGIAPPAGAPGSGVRGDATSSYELLETTVAAAPGGVTYDTPPGTLVTYAGSARRFALPSPLREGQVGTLSIDGEMGDVVGFFWAFDSQLLPMPARNGWFLIAAPFLAGPFLVGAITDPSGTWDVPITGPNLPAAFEAQTFLLQAYFVHVGGATLGSGTAFTLVDASF